MQPAGADVVQNFTVPASAATAGDFFVARMSMPWCGPCGRGAPKSSTYCTLPTTGKMIRDPCVMGVGVPPEVFFAGRPPGLG